MIAMKVGSVNRKIKTPVLSRGHIKREVTSEGYWIQFYWKVNIGSRIVIRENDVAAIANQRGRFG
jgi:hypothetical protein